MKLRAVNKFAFLLNLVFCGQLSKAGPTQSLLANSTVNQPETETKSPAIYWEEVNNSQREGLDIPMQINEVDHPFWFNLGKPNSKAKPDVVLARFKRDLSVAIQRVLGPQFLSIQCQHKSFNQCTKSAPTKLYLYPLEGSLSTFVIHDGSTAIGAISKSPSLQYTQTSDLEYIYNNPRYHWAAQTENGFSKFINVAAGLALDANGVGDVYLHESLKGNYYQNWKLREWSSKVIDLGPDSNWEVPVNTKGFRLQSTVTKGFVSLRCNQGTKKACAVPQYFSPLPIEFTPVNADYSDDQQGTSVYIHDLNKDDNTKYAIGVAVARHGSGKERVGIEDLRIVSQDPLYHWLVVVEQGDNRRFVNIATGYTLAIQATEPTVVATAERGNAPLTLTRL